MMCVIEDTTVLRSVR